MNDKKKVLHKVWLVQDKMPNSEPLYFAGLVTNEVTGNVVSRFEPLSEATKFYKSEKGAKIGASKANKFYESPFITPVLFERLEIHVTAQRQKKQALEPAENVPIRTPLVLVPASERSGWVLLDKLCGKHPYMLRKKVGDIFRFAIAYTDTDIRYLPADEVYAWTRYFEECTEFVVNRIRSHRIAEGKDPDGADAWKKGGGT